MMKHPSLVGLIIAVAVVYLPIILVLVLRKKSCSDVIAIGGLVTILCLAVEVMFRPFGLVIFLTIHAFALYLWIARSSSGNQGEEE